MSTGDYYYKTTVVRIALIGLFLGITFGGLAGVGSTYFTMKNKQDTELSSMAQQLRLCEEKLDKK